jgi:hypothetical protein
MIAFLSRFQTWRLGADRQLRKGEPVPVDRIDPKAED